ncbi:hypothetical protein [Streptomyces antioxidans]|uniref:hypothetical protein n=1 Tax=Streptomyces antioxidans TaxID=1507734 RepID=UPI0006147651|nr:hypothetical protein [Streptomyces antioxidans]
MNGNAVTVEACFAVGYRGGFGGSAKDYTLVTDKRRRPRALHVREAAGRPHTDLSWRYVVDKPEEGHQGTTITAQRSGDKKRISDSPSNRARPTTSPSAP